MGTERNTLFGDLSKLSQRIQLKSAAVCQDRMIPGHESMKSAHFPDDFRTRPEMQMIGVAQGHLAAHPFQILGRYAPFDGSPRRHIHENRSLDDAMRSIEFSSAGTFLCLQDAKSQF